MNINKNGKKVAVIGSSACANPDVIKRILGKNVDRLKLLVCGVTRDIDTKTQEWAAEAGVPYIVFPAKKGDKGAVLRRNRTVMEYADSLIVLWDGKSEGAKMQIEMAGQLGKPFKIVILNEAELKLVVLENLLRKSEDPCEAQLIVQQIDDLKGENPTAPATPSVSSSTPTDAEQGPEDTL